MAQRLIDVVFDALDEQTVTVPGTGTLDVGVVVRTDLGNHAHGTTPQLSG